MIVTMATVPACSRTECVTALYSMVYHIPCCVTALYSMVYHIPYMYVHHKLAYKHLAHKGVLDSLPVLVVVQGVPLLQPHTLICFFVL